MGGDTQTSTARTRGHRRETLRLWRRRAAKAERNAPLVAVPQAPTAKGNNLSTGAKVAIGVGIAVAVVIFVVKSPILNDGR